MVGRVFQLLLVFKLLLSSRDISLVRDEDIFILMSFARSRTCELELADLHLTGGCQHVSGFIELRLFTVRPHWLLQML